MEGEADFLEQYETYRGELKDLDKGPLQKDVIKALDEA